MCAYLRAAVGDLVEDRVWRPQVPQQKMAIMPTAAIAVRRAGGYKLFGGSQMPVSDPVLDFMCYGSNAAEAELVSSAVATALKQLSMTVWENTMLYWAVISGGPLPMVDTQTLWPGQLLSAQVMHADYQTAG
jgi:hypothetical protein